MKIRLLIVALTVCMIVTQATADPFTLNYDAALLLTMQDAYHGSSPYTVGLDSGSPYTDPAAYNPPPPGFMQGQVGFIGQLDPDYTGDVFGWMQIGGGTSTGDVIDKALGLGYSSNDLSGYDSFELFVANDNDDFWGAMLYVETASGTYYSSGDTSITSYSEFTELSKHTSQMLTMDISSITDRTSVLDLGFVVGGSHIQAINDDYPSYPDYFHISVVPTPAAVLLGILGLGVAGWKLRRFA